MDLFEEEQKIHDNAVKRAAEARAGASFDLEEFAALVNAYGKLLKQLRRATRMADRTTINLHESNLDLNGKVNFDALTGIYNRRYMEAGLKRIMNTIVRSGGGQLSVMMMDVDFFKKYNDTYGHGAGDVCLKSVANAIAACVTRSDDFVARYGGEEFAVILPNTDQNGACKLAGEILEKVRACNIPHEKNEAASCVTVSIGVTTGDIGKNFSETEYVKRADEALYMSKQNGRNRYTYISFK